MAKCKCCEIEKPSSRHQPLVGPRQCPACGHRFRGAGWRGFARHWRQWHQAKTGVRYEDMRDDMCARHYGICTSEVTNLVAVGPSWPSATGAV